jgi:hypothetical protein
VEHQNVALLGLALALLESIRQGWNPPSKVFPGAKQKLFTKVIKMPSKEVWFG